MRALLIAAMLVSGTWAAAPRPAVRFEPTSDGGYYIEAAFDVPVAPAAAWAVLTDYDHLARFVSSMKRSVVLRRAPCLLVEQESDAHAWIFHRQARVVLDIQERPPDLIEFSDVSRAHFDYYAGSWSLQEVARGSTLVVYQLKAKGGLGAPRRLLSGAARRTVAELLDQVRAEMLRRSTPS